MIWPDCKNLPAVAKAEMGFCGQHGIQSMLITPILAGGVLMVYVATVTQFLCVRYWGELSDRFGEISATLRSNHDKERMMAESVAGELKRLIEGEALSRPVRFFGDTIRLYRIIRSHIDWENRILIPLARRRLRDLDYPYLMEKIGQRRRERPPHGSGDLG